MSPTPKSFPTALHNWWLHAVHEMSAETYTPGSTDAGRPETASRVGRVESEKFDETATIWMPSRFISGMSGETETPRYERSLGKASAVCILRT